LFTIVFFSKQVSAEETINYDTGLQKVRDYTKTKNFQEAETLLKGMLSRYPDNSELLEMLGRILFWEKKYDESLTVYKRLLEVRPSQKAEEDMNRVISAKELQIAQELQDRGNIKEAEERLKLLYNSGRDRYSAGYQLGILYIRQRDYDEALKIFSELRTYYPEDSGFEELYLESLILTGNISMAKEGLNSLPEDRRAKLHDRRDDLFYRVRRNYMMIGTTWGDYDQGMKDERQHDVKWRQRIAEKTFVFSFSNIERFGITDSQAGLEIYSKLGEKTKRWGYLSFTASPGADFLPRWTAEAAAYQGYRNLDLSLGYAHMEFNSSSVDRLMPGIIVYLPYRLALNETLFINLRRGTTTLLSKIHYEPNHKFNCYYSYSSGSSAEEIGSLQDIEKISTYSHGAEFEYRFVEQFSIGAGLKFSRRENSYTQNDITFFAKYWW